MTELKMYGNRPVPKYCAACGSRLRATFPFSHYDPVVGDKRWGVKLKCTGTFGFLHQSFEFNSEGNEIISYEY